MRNAIQALSLAVLVAGAFAFTVRNDFIGFDDDKVIYQNEQVLKGLTVETGLWALRSTELANWYPLTRLSHLVDVSLFGLAPGSHHLASAAWHAVATALLFLAAQAMTGKTGRSLVIAGVFGVHPLQVESVAWASERSDVLAGAFFAATLLLWIRYVRRPGPERFGACVAAFALGLMAKPTVVTLPFVLLLLDFWPLGRFSDRGHGSSVAPGRLWRCFLEKTPFLLLSALASSLTMATQARSDALHNLASLPVGARLSNAVVSYWAYLKKWFWPAHLGLFYPMPIRGIETSVAVVAGLALAVLTLVVVLGLSRRRPWLGVGWLWFLGMLVPMIGLVKAGDQAIADRFLHLPMIGLALGVVWQASESLAVRQRRAVAFGLGVALLGALSLRTVVQSWAWKDSRTIYEHTLAVTQDNWLIHNNLSAVLMGIGRHEEALAHAQEAVRIRPGFDGANYNLGTALFAVGRYEEAVASLRRAILLKPTSAEAHYNLGNALAALGRHGEAVASFRNAISLKPTFLAARFNMGRSLAALGRHEEAIAIFREYLAVQTGFADGYFNLGASLVALGRYQEAFFAFREALRLKPDSALGWYEIGGVFTNLGRLGEAAAAFREALRLRPGYALASRRLEEVLALQGTPAAR